MLQAHIFCLTFFCLLLYVISRCPNWCNKHGICTSPTDSGYCICDPSWRGDDCSIKMCPKAYDPVTLESRPNRRTVRLSTKHEGGKLFGQLMLQFGRETFRLNADASEYTTEQCTSDLRSFKPVAESSCQRESFDAETGEGAFVITFQSWPLEPWENNLFTHNGNPDISLFSCNTSRVDLEEVKGLVCEVSDVVTEDLPDYLECGGHGSCRGNGTCACERGFYGEACHSIQDNLDIMSYVHDGPFFAATMLKLKVIRDPSPKFNLFHVEVAPTETAPPSFTTSIRGDGTIVHRGDVAVTDGTLSLTASDKGKSVHKSDGAVLTLRSDVTLPSDAGFALVKSSVVGPHRHLQALFQNSTVLVIEHNGTISTLGSLEAANHTFSVHNGLVSAVNVQISNSLDVRGSIHLEDSLTIGTGFALTPEGMTVDSSSHVGSLIELRSNVENFTGSLLDIHSQADGNNNVSLMRTVVNGQTTFNLNAKGDLELHSLRMHTGGVLVEAGGVHVEAGGVHVQGGVHILSGGLSLHDQKLQVEELDAYSSSPATPSILAANTNPDFVGSIVDVVGLGSGSRNTGKTEGGHFSYLRVRDSGKGEGEGDTVLEVGSNGRLSVAGDVAVGQDALVGGKLSVAGSVSRGRVSIMAGDLITIPTNVSYVVIEDDHKLSRNQMAFETDSTVTEGQELFVTNLDGDVTASLLKIPPQATVHLIYGRQGWQDISVLTSGLTELKNIHLLELANDVFLGNVTISMGKVRLTQTGSTGGARAGVKGGLLSLGPNGLVVSSEALTYAKETLYTPGIHVSRLVSDVDSLGHTIKNAIIQDSALSNVSITASSIIIPTAGSGLVYLDATGSLRTVGNHISVTDDKLKIEHVHSNINFNGFAASNLHLKDVSLTEVNEIRFRNIRILPDLQSDILKQPYKNPKTTGYFLVVPADRLSCEVAAEESPETCLQQSIEGTGESVQSSTSLLLDGDVVRIKKLSGFQLTGEIFGQGNTIDHVVLWNSQLSNASSVSTNRLNLQQLQVEQTNLKGKKKRILIAYANGDVSVDELTADADDNPGGDNYSKFPFTPSMHLHSLVVTAKGNNKDVDGDNSNRGGGVVRAEVVQATEGLFSAIRLAPINNNKNGDAASSTNSRLMATDSTGKIVPAGGIILINGTNDSTSVLKVDIPSTFANSLDVYGDLKLSRGGPGQVLIVDELGNVVGTRDLDLGSLRVNNVSAEEATVVSLKLTGGAFTSGLLSVDKDGLVVGSSEAVLQSLNTTSMSTKSLVVESSFLLSQPEVQSGLLYADETGLVTSVRNVSVADLKADRLTVTDALHTSDLYLSGEGAVAGVLVVDDVGKAARNSSIFLEALQAVELSAESIRLRGEFPNREGVVTVEKNGSLRTSTIISVSEVSVTEKLTVNNKAMLTELQLKGLSSTLLAVDENGFVSAGNITAMLNDVSLSPASIRVDGAASFGHVEVRSIDVGDILYVGEAGVLSGTRQLAVNSLSSANVVTKELTVDNLTLNMSVNVDPPVSRDGGTDSGKEKAVLVVGATGRVTPTTALKINEVRSALLFTGTLSVSGSVVLEGLEEREGQGKQLVGADDEGRLGTVKNISGLSSVQTASLTTNRLEVLDSLTLKKIEVLSNVEDKQAVNVLVLDPKTNEIRQSSELKVSNVRTDTLAVDETTVKNSLVLPNIRSSVLFTDDSGVVSGGDSLVIKSMTVDTLEVKNKLQVGSLQLQPSSTAIQPDRPLVVKESGELQSTDKLFGLQSVATTDLRVDNNLLVGTVNTMGNVNVGGQMEVAKDMYISGTVTVQGSVIGSGPYVDTSDRRYKRNIEPVPNSLDIISQLQAVRYDYKTEEFPEKRFPTAKQIGWIADEVERVLPELVVTDEEGYKSVAYARAVSVLASAIHELKQQVDRLVALEDARR